MSLKVFPFFLQNRSGTRGASTLGLERNQKDTGAATATCRTGGVIHQGGVFDTPSGKHAKKL